MVIFLFIFFIVCYIENKRGWEWGVECFYFFYMYYKWVRYGRGVSESGGLG